MGAYAAKAPITITGLSGLSAKYVFHRCSNSGPISLKSSPIGLSLIPASNALWRDVIHPCAEQYILYTWVMTLTYLLGARYRSPSIDLCTLCMASFV
jgi:hypothetical protein